MMHHVDVKKVSLVSVGDDKNPTSRFPALGVWTNILDFEDDVENSVELEDSISSYVIRHIESADSGTGVTVIFTRDTETDDFEDLEDMQDSEVPVFSMKIPIQYLAVMNVLQNAPQGFFMVVFDKRVSIRPSIKRSISLDDVVLAISLPDEESDENESICHQMLDMVSDYYALPLEEEDEDYDVPLSVRKAQGVLLSTLIGVSLGDVSSFKRFLAMEEWITTLVLSQTANATEDEKEKASSYSNEHNAFVEGVIRLLHIMMMTRSTTEPEAQDVLLTPISGGEKNEEFLQMMRENNLEHTLREISASSQNEGSEKMRINAQILSTQHPFSGGWPARMLPIKNFIENDSVLSQRIRLWEQDLVGESNIAIAAESENFAEVMTAFLLVIAARGSRFARARAINSGSTIVEEVANPSIIFAQWLNSDPDTHMWEIEAMGPLVENYEIEQFVDLLSTSQSFDGDIRHSQYLVILWHSLVHQLHDEGWTVQALTTAAHELDLKTTHFTHTLATANYLIDEIKEEDNDDDDECYAFSAVDSTVSSGMFTLHDFATAGATLVPMLADISAAKNNLSVGDENWKEYRSTYIINLLKRASNSAWRKFS